MTITVLIILQEALVVPYGYSWSFTIRPNDLREDRLPRDITESIHWLISTRWAILGQGCSYLWRLQLMVRTQDVWHFIEDLKYLGSNPTGSNIGYQLLLSKAQHCAEVNERHHNFEFHPTVAKIFLRRNVGFKVSVFGRQKKTFLLLQFK